MQLAMLSRARCHLLSPPCSRRKTRYQSAPRNIYRHIVLSEVKEAMAALPLVRGPDRAQAVVALASLLYM